MDQKEKPRRGAVAEHAIARRVREGRNVFQSARCNTHATRMRCSVYVRGRIMLNGNDRWPIRCPCGHTTQTAIEWLWNVDKFECEGCGGQFAFNKEAFRVEVRNTRQHVHDVQMRQGSFLGERLK